MARAEIKIDIDAAIVIEQTAKREKKAREDEQSQRSTQNSTPREQEGGGVRAAFQDNMPILAPNKNELVDVRPKSPRKPSSEVSGTFLVIL